MSRVPLAFAATLVVVAVALSGCTTPADSVETARLVLRDGEKRVAGEPCNGSGPYRDIHATASFVVRDADGDVLAEGALPQGVATKMIDIDFDGIAEPTACTFTLDAAIPDGLGTVYLDAGERTEVVMMPNQDDDVWEAILP
ncbi:hypothetical protein ACFC3F_10745 [Microbacterium sp. NPDC055910]|uniref:hypothetical protein n=1 Tax=Microbacterium sp. NPDC055910 TaxID=3345659 RepID=UPI0035D6D7D6